MEINSRYRYTDFDSDRAGMTETVPGTFSLRFETENSPSCAPMYVHTRDHGIVIALNLECLQQSQIDHKTYCKHIFWISRVIVVQARFVISLCQGESR